MAYDGWVVVGSLFPAGYAADCISFARMMGEDEEMDLDEVIAEEGSFDKTRRG